MTADEPEKPRRLPRFSLRTLVLFVAVCGSGYGLWVNWGPWKEAYNFMGSGVFDLDFSADGKKIRTFCSSESGVLLVLYDAADGKYLEASTIPESPSRHDRYGSLSEEVGQTFTSDGSRFLAVDERDIIHVYSLRRPIQWYGIFHLKEFWLTLALTLTLLWSLRRDWKGLPVGQPTGEAA